MPPPKAIVCHLCNGKYFSRSFPIHLKQCEKKWKETHSRCEYCGMAVSKFDWSDHRAHCKPTKKKKRSNHSKNMPLVCPKAPMDQMLPTSKQVKLVRCEECGTERAMWQCTECEQSLCAKCEVNLHKKGARIRHTRIPLNAQALHAKNISVSATTNDCKENEEVEPVQDHRAQCKFCGRRFNPDRVEKHMRICNAIKKNNGAKRRKVWDGPGKRIEDTEFAQYKYNRSKTPEKVKEWKKNGRRWRQESNQLRQIAVVHEDLKEVRKKNVERKDEESDIIIKAPAHKPVFKKFTPSAPSISGVSNGNEKKFPSMKGSRIRVGQRSASNKSSGSNSSKSSARRYVSKFERKKKNDKDVNKNDVGVNDRVNRRRTSNKKPGIPKFSRAKSGSNSSSIDMNQSLKSQSFGLKAIKKARSKVTSSFKSKPVSNRRPKPMQNTRSKSNVVAKKSYNKPAPVQQQTKPVQEEFGRANKRKISKPKPVQQENNQSVNNRQARKPTFKRTKSEANSLARGSELGNNVKKIFDDEPTTMDNYMERERIRRQKRAKVAGNKSSSSSSSAAYKPGAKPKVVSEPAFVPKKKPKSIVPTNAMSRLQIRKDIKKIDNRQIGSNTTTSINKLGGSIANKPRGPKDLASKRAAYFESLLKNQEE